MCLILDCHRQKKYHDCHHHYIDPTCQVNNCLSYLDDGGVPFVVFSCPNNRAHYCGVNLKYQISQKNTGQIKKEKSFYVYINVISTVFHGVGRNCNSSQSHGPYMEGNIFLFPLHASFSVTLGDYSGSMTKKTYTMNL